jgi:hypothetical protein
MRTLIFSVFITTGIIICGQNTFQIPQVSADSLMKHVEFFSAPDKKGRLPGTDGYHQSADYTIALFKEFGIEPLPGYDQYRQYLPLENNLITGPCDFHVIHYEKGIIQAVHGDNYSFRGFTGSGKMTVETVFCGYGLCEEGFDEYAGVDVKGKAVLIYKGNPKFSSGKDYEPFSIRSRANTAKEHGAAAVIFIPEPGNERPKPIGSVMCGQGEYYPEMPLLQIDFETSDYLFQGSGFTAEQLFLLLQEKQQPVSLSLPSKVYINVSSEYKSEIKSYNILGFLKGSDPVLQNEFILITAHIDHVGFQCDVIYPGANDNASGSAAVIELARLFSKNKPARSIIFVLFTAEESGLEGSNFLASHLPVEDDQIVAAFNFDCIAVGDSIQIGNGLTNPGLYKSCKSFDHTSLMVTQTWKGGGADLTPFSELGIPGLYFVSKYSYPHLHLPSDTPETINTELFRNLVQLGFETARFAGSSEYIREKTID